MDNTPMNEMRDQRKAGIASKFRDQSVEENLKWWNEMKEGTEEVTLPINPYIVTYKKITVTYNSLITFSINFHSSKYYYLFLFILFVTFR